MSITSKTITLTGEEITVKFDRQYPYFWVINHGNSNVYMSDSPGIVPNADGIVTVPAGGGARLWVGQKADALYLFGNEEVHIFAQYNAACPVFNPKRKGGENDKSNEIFSEGFVYSSAIILDDILSTDKLYEEASA